MKRVFIFTILAALSGSIVGADTVRITSDVKQSDCTEILQKAIDSNASKIIISKDGSPWVTRPLHLRSNLEIVIEEGAVIQTKPGEFKNAWDCMFSADGCKNLIIRGPGSLVMDKKAFQDKSQYKPAEWRHAIRLFSCENVIIENLKINGSGGDGIYVGSGYDPARNTLPDYSENIAIKSCTIDNQHRQGISVISVKNLTVIDCTISNTDGTWPMSAIDFEPNRKGQFLSNCIVERCNMVNNRGDGVQLYINELAAKTPISITVKDCVIKGGGNGFSLSNSPVAKNLSQGYMNFINCRVENCDGAGIEIGNLFVGGIATCFDKCIIKDCAVKNLNLSQVMFSIGANAISNVGGVQFKDTVITDNNKRPVMGIVDHSPEAGVDKVVGDIVYNGEKLNVENYIKGLVKPENKK